MKCEALRSHHWAPNPYCSREARWRGRWAGGYVHYCGIHKRYRLRQGIKNWKALG